MGNMSRTPCACVTAPFSLAIVAILNFYSFPALAITLADAEVIALSDEPGSGSYTNHQRALEELSVSAGQLPDPRIQLGGLNMPTNSFDLNQEPMTQVRVGIKQEFPAGDTRSIRQRQTLIESEGMAYRASERRLAVRRDVRTGWFEALYWQSALEILSEDRALLQQLVQVTESLYQVGRRGQHDLARASLELGQLEDRILQASRNLEIAVEAVERWTGSMGFPVETRMEWTNLTEPSGSLGNREDVAMRLIGHPLVRGMESAVQVSEQALALAREQYKPAWDLEVGYGFRSGQNSDLTDRTDFLSVLATIDLPLFRGNRQDKVASARAYEWAAAQDSYADALRVLTRDAITEYEKWQQVSGRLALYEESILPQARLQAEATLRAYQADTTDFAELMRASLSEQLINLDYQRLRTDEQQVLARLHYLLPDDSDLEVSGND
jgi:outer membrane protein TolC